VRDNAPTSSKTIYHSMVNTAVQNTAPAPITSAPRNVEQIRNTKKIQRNLARLSHYALYNVHELAYDSNCIHYIVTYPVLSVICYNPDLVEVFNSLLSSFTDQDKPTVTVTYDTPFNLGDFYVSVLLFRETEFDPSPIVPLAFLLHERKLQSTHDEFFSQSASCALRWITQSTLSFI